MVTIYKITSLSGKIYVGQTIDVVKRKRSYQSLNCKSQVLLYNSLRKHGWKNHLFEVLCEVNDDLGDEVEISYIAQLNSCCYNNPNGLNIALGGKRTVVSQQTKDI